MPLSGNQTLYSDPVLELREFDVLIGHRRARRGQNNNSYTEKQKLKIGLLSQFISEELQEEESNSRPAIPVRRLHLLSSGSDFTILLVATQKRYEPNACLRSSPYLKGCPAGFAAGVMYSGTFI